MHVDIKGVHIDVTDTMRQHVDGKLKHLDFAKDMIIDLLVTISREKAYKVEANINFRWGASAHLSVEAFDILEGIDGLFHKIENKVTREKGKIQEHGPRTQ